MAPRVNQSAGHLRRRTSGRLNNGTGGAAESRNLDDYRSRASISYVTGTHNAKFGYDGGYFTQTGTTAPATRA